MAGVSTEVVSHTPIRRYGQKSNGKWHFVFTFDNIIKTLVGCHLSELFFVYFGCEDAAQQVLMSVCLSVCGQFEILLYSKVPECSRKFQKVPESSRMYQNVDS